MTVVTSRFNWRREPAPPITELAVGADERGTWSRRSTPGVGRIVTVRSADAKRPAVFGASPSVARLALGVSPRGRVAVAWSTFSRAEHNHTPVRIYAALREPGRPFAGARLMEQQPDVDEYADEPGGFPDLALGADGRAVLDVGQPGRREDPLARVRRAPGHGFGTFQTLARDAVPGDVAIGDDGRVLVTWVNRAVHARLSTPGGRFGAAETLGRGILPFASFAADGRPRVQWVSGWDSAPKLHTATRG